MGGVKGCETADRRRHQPGTGKRAGFGLLTLGARLFSRSVTNYHSALKAHLLDAAPQALPLKAMIRPVGLEVSGLERRRAEGVFVAAHEHRDDHLRFDAQPFFQSVADVAEQALLVGADGALW